MLSGRDIARRANGSTQVRTSPLRSRLRLSALTLPFGSIDLLFEQHPLDVSVTVLRKDGDFDVRVLK